MHLKVSKYQVSVLGQASLPEVYAIHQWLQLNFVHNACFKIGLGICLKEKNSPLSYPKLSNMNSLAVPELTYHRGVGRSGIALGNGSAIDAKVS